MSDGRESERRIVRGNGRERENERGREKETGTVSAPKSGRERETGRETEATSTAKIEADPENRVVTETEIRRRNEIVRKMRRRRMNAANWRGSCERRRRPIKSV